MKVGDLIKQLKRTDSNNEVRLCANSINHYTKFFNLSFDDNGDVLIYEIEE